MKYLFIVQGEGRGHLTQAISLAQIIERKGHQVVGALVGSSKGDFTQKFFMESFQGQIIPFASPALAYSKKTKALSVSKTFFALVCNFRLYLKSLFQIDKKVKELRPDVIVNFYDTLGGVHQALFRIKAPMVCLAHQYLMLHEDFLHPKGNVLNRILVNFNTRITALGAERKLALSFYRGESDKNIHLVPPLLRSEVKKLQPETDNYFLAYVTQQSMADEVARWQKRFPETIIHCFSDKPQQYEVEEVSKNLFFHKIDGEKFLEMMRKCKGLISTAGFESVCEAMLLGKPVMMVPMQNHYEQTCNALDGEQSGAGIYRKTFEISDFMAFIPKFESKRAVFSEWESESSYWILNQINAVVQSQTNRLGYSQTKLAPLLKSLKLHR